MRKIIFEEILQYYDKVGDPDERIQIVTGNRDWDSADELEINSELLKPLMKWVIMDMSFEESYKDKTPILRVLINPA